MGTYQYRWGDMAKILWVKSHAEEGGVETNDHENENKRAGEDAEGAYAHPPCTANGTAPILTRYTERQSTGRRLYTK